MQDDDLFLGTDETRLGHDDSVAGVEDAKAMTEGLDARLGRPMPVLEDARRAESSQQALTDQEALIEPPRGLVPELPDGGSLPEPLVPPTTTGMGQYGPGHQTGLIEPDTND